ncbi:MAG TPA: hypothetical protein VK932_01790 [Kofleriaceae bacterium]|nr:hypothetical protein [Kofleriaceae bacterium]
MAHHVAPSHLPEWLAHARKEAEDGFAELDRGEGILGTAAEHMARIDAAVRARVTRRTRDGK